MYFVQMQMESEPNEKWREAQTFEDGPEDSGFIKALDYAKRLMRETGMTIRIVEQTVKWTFNPRPKEEAK